MAKLLAVLIFAVFCGAALSTPLNPSGPVPKSLKFVATADKKSFFADSTPMTWLEARTYCRNNGLKFASIENPKEEAELEKAFDSTNFNGAHWTSGRDAHAAAQFLWDDTKTALLATLKFTDQNPLAYQTCVLYHIRPAQFKETGLRFAKCTETFGVLCEAS